jgi:FSR family fosmidomycin resistance protein-like MFS transporter
LAAISFCHFLNDMLQSVIPAVYPILKQAIAWISADRLDHLSVQLTASLLQPFVGMYTDHRPTPYSLPVGMGFTLSGLLLLAYAPRFGTILVAVALVGVGSSVFHPESSRVARLASGRTAWPGAIALSGGGQCRVGAGSAAGRADRAAGGQRSIAWFSAAALLAIIVLTRIGAWYKSHGEVRAKAAAAVHERGRNYRGQRPARRWRC